MESSPCAKEDGEQAARENVKGTSSVWCWVPSINDLGLVHIVFEYM